eukprot:TRINITY_DN133_c0_g1_i1.p1 TRINITY_DN133_c0_g1~~TRINITY_DN133_c0_g1_i1.p1  ORF type:complete len:215 (+),score=14.96 TRINITY_DN133_c0_g1_i1:50-694(+)
MQSIKIVVIGSQGVGKSALLLRYTKNIFHGQYAATIGADFMTKDLSINGVVVTAQLWDTAGQERFRGLGSAFFRGADGCVLVYDTNDDKTFRDLLQWHTSLLVQTNCPDPQNFPFVLLGNKIDLQETRAVSSHKAVSWSHENRFIGYYEVSAKEGTNVVPAFDDLCKAAYKFKLKHYQGKNIGNIVIGRSTFSDTNSNTEETESTNTTLNCCKN